MKTPVVMEHVAIWLMVLIVCILAMTAVLHGGT
jgi:hypothetical protein